MRQTTLQGILGRAIRLTAEKRLKQADYPLLESPFRNRDEKDNAWRCEFWGKITRSAVTAAWATGDAELKKMLRTTVEKIMATRTGEGCVSSYPAELQLKGWDVWGRKYVLLALLRYYEMLDPDPAVLECCCRMADHLMTQVGPEEGKTDILSCGWHNGLAASSILGAFVALWRLTREDRYRTFAEYIIRRGCSSLGNIFDDLRAGIVPALLGSAKAYEMTSCFQGMAELVLLEPDPARRETLIRYYEAVRDREIFVTGVGGAKDICGEYWYDGALRQTRPGSYGLGETCVTATWIHYCMRILELTGDAKVADELEKSLYNGILGAMAPDGTRWVHINPTPLTGGGWKRCADDQIGRGFGTPFGGNDCCRAQGPEGLVSAALFAVTGPETEPTVNLFEPLVSGDLVIEGNYPCEPEAVLHFTSAGRRKLRLRTPGFLAEVTLDGSAIPFIPGQYLEIDREWIPGDRLKLTFDFTLREIPAPDGSPYVAVKRGPLVLAADSRGDLPEAFVHETWRGIPLCDYASAGNLMCETNPLTVWFPAASGKNGAVEHR